MADIVIQANATIEAMGGTVSTTGVDRLVSDLLQAAPAPVANAPVAPFAPAVPASVQADVDAGRVVPFPQCG